eukprot:GFUD01044771.1.p1 GENE.GFUD01044771.1~~GFUD01044771.1.p1  ORF type:complete len:1713 (+),score=410.65 GFUD01044771.1:554-5140(+)
MEQGIEGKCKNTYQVSELPEYLIHEYEQGMIKLELCKGKKFYQVMKTRDITKCIERSTYISSKTHYKCLLGNCNGVNTKSSTTRYFGCGENIEALQLHGMINEGELQHNVLAFNTEPVVTGTKQVLKLVAITPVTTTIPEIVAPTNVIDLLFEFPKTANNFIPVGLDNLPKEEMKAKVIAKLTAIATELGELEHFGKKEIPSQLKSLKTVLAIFTTKDLKAVYTSIKAISVPAEIKLTMRTLFLEAVKMAGSSPCVMFLKEMIETEELTYTETFMAVTTLAHYIKTPTVELIDQIFELIKSPVVRKEPTLKTNAHLVFATLVRQACLATKVNEVFPEYVFGTKCSPDNKKISQVYIPHLVKELESATEAEKQTAVLALGTIGHEAVIPLLLPYIEGKVEGCTPAVRKMAIYSLVVVTKKYRNILLPVFSSLVHNPAEKRGIRLAAFSMLLNSQPSTVHIQKLAVSTWFEQDVEMHKFIFSSLKSLAHISLDQHPEGSYLKDLTIKAQTVLPLAKPIPGIISSTFNSFISGVLKNLHIGCQMHTAFSLGTASQFLYHKTEYFLKQVQTVPMEFAVHVDGLKFFADNLINSITGEYANYLEKIHPEWRQIVQNMEFSARKYDHFEAGIWARFTDDIQFVFGANFKSVDFIKEWILSSLQAPAKSLKKVCGKTPININHVFEEFAYQALVPSDLGFPILIESQATYLVSMKGEVDVMCSNPVPSIALKVTKKAAFTYNGYVGVVCPFTNKLLAAGINEHRAINIPIKTVVEIVPGTSSMKIVMKQIDEVTPTTTSIDLHHYHVKPFTAMKPLVFLDLTPIVLHKNTKVIKSKANMKTFQATIGQTFGLDMTYKVDTECDLYDTKALIDSLADYKYNPIIKGFFHFTDTAVKANGMPSARFHKYTVMHNPAKSTTKEAEINIMITLARKIRTQQPQIVIFSTKYVITTIELPKITKHEQSLHESILKLNSELSYAVNALVTAKLVGGLPKSYTYSITAGKGSSSLEHKWNLHLENVYGVVPLMKMCVEGGLKYPIVPNSDTNFKYFNHIGFGQTCDQYFVNFDGTTFVTDKQKQYSKISYESKQCEKLTIESQKISKLSRKYSQVAHQQQNACKAKKYQANTLDQAVIDITTSDVLPAYVYYYGKLVNFGLKALLFKYISAFPTYTHTDKVQVKFNFNQKLNTVTMYVKTPMDTMVYKNIRLPAEMKKILPLVAIKNPVEQTYKALTGSPLYAKCVIGQGYVQTFDKKTYSYQLDHCDHIVASDCSEEYNHAVLAKEVNGLKHITVYHGQTKISLKPTWKLELNGKEIAMVKNSVVYFKSVDQQHTYSAFWSLENFVILDTPFTRVTYTGKMVTVEEKSIIADGSHCGLCGDLNNDLRADIKSPKGCVYKSSSVAALTYRVKNAQCTLSQKQKQQIQSEEQKCMKYKIVKTHVSTLYQSWYKYNYSTMKHSYIYQAGKICISQKPVVQCLFGSIPKITTKKTIKFICLPEGRVSKLYAERIERGESLPELRHQPVAFESMMEQPISCGPPKL